MAVPSFTNAAKALFLATALAVAVPVPGGTAEAPPTCFFDQVVQLHPSALQATLIARSSLFIAQIRPDGMAETMGTGFVVRGSAGADGRLRILTAAHVVVRDADTSPDARLMAFFSNGRAIGVVTPVVVGAQRATSVGGIDMTVEDLAVATVTAFAGPKAEAEFLALEGLDLAEGGGALAVGEASTPQGAIWGQSGSAAVDDQGRVVGVLTQADFRGRVRRMVGAIADTNAAGRPVARERGLPERSLVVVEPIDLAPVRAALGRNASDPPLSAGPVAVVIAGFPLGSCAATRAALEPVGTPAAERLLADWRAPGPVGAWVLPFEGVGRLDYTEK